MCRLFLNRRANRHTMNPIAVLRTEDLAVEFSTQDAPVRAVQRVSIEVYAGETVALVGESGSGKSVTCLSVMGLLPETGRVSEGRIEFKKKDILAMESVARRRLRGAAMSMVFQEPMTSLNPVFRIGSQIAEAVEVQTGIGRKEAMHRAKDLLDLVRIPEASRRLKNYPHELSGGMRQRVMIAMALAGNPDLLIADEPTTALDVTVQAQILELLAELQAELGMALLFVTHDLGVVAGIADRVYVMYGGQVVESAPVRPLFAQPRMPYTAGLLRSVPSLSRDEVGRMPTIPGQGPAPGEAQRGCTFAPRCEFVQEACRVENVPILESGNRAVRCLRAEELSLS